MSAKYLINSEIMSDSIWGFMKLLNMQKIYWFTFLFGLLFASCENNSSSTAARQGEATIGKKELKRKTSPRLLHVYLFDQFPASVANQMLAELKKVYPSVRMEGRISLPDSAYFAPKKRYLAKKLWNTMMTLQANNDMVLGMTTEDISLKYKDYENWGVFGLSYLNKRSAVISTYRLRSQSKLMEHFRKLMLHELGHAEGIPHCKSMSCIMQDLKGKNRFSQLNDFCPSCKKVLKVKGWLF